MIFLFLNFTQFIVSLLENFNENLINVGDFFLNVINEVFFDESLVDDLFSPFFEHSIDPSLGYTRQNNRNVFNYCLFGSIISMSDSVNISPHLWCHNYLRGIFLLLEFKGHFLVSFEADHRKVITTVEFFLWLHDGVFIREIKDPLLALTVLYFQIDLESLKTRELLIGQVIIVQDCVIAPGILRFINLFFFLNFLIGTLSFELFAFVFEIGHLSNFRKRFWKFDIFGHMHQVIIILDGTQTHHDIGVVGFRVVLFIFHLEASELWSYFLHRWLSLFRVSTKLVPNWKLFEFLTFFAMILIFFSVTWIVLFVCR